MKTNLFLLLLVLVSVLTSNAATSPVDCSCFSADCTPDNIRVYINGVPYDHFEYNAGCCWDKYLSDKLMFTYEPSESEICLSFLWIIYDPSRPSGVDDGFEGFNPNPCTTYFVNWETNPQKSIWYGVIVRIYPVLSDGRVIIGDFNRDCVVGFTDFAILVNDWLYDCSDPNVYYNDPNRNCHLGTDLTGDGWVDWDDLRIFQQYWQKSYLE